MPQEIEDLIAIMRSLVARGKSIILITHKLKEIEQVADRCVIIRRGQLVDTVNVADTTTQEMADKWWAAWYTSTSTSSPRRRVSAC